MIKIAVFGGGRMAFEVAQAAAESDQVQLAALVARKKPDWLQEQVWVSSLQELDTQPDLLIDFTLAGGTFDAAHWCRSRLVPMVSGTTGLSEADRKALFEAAELVPVMWAPNLSKGLNLLMKSIVEAALTLPQDTPVEILDIHHVHKKDAPSGTALLLARAIASARHQELEDCLVVEGTIDGASLAPGAIHCTSRREGEVIGTHRVRFFAGAENVSFEHDAHDRNIYASGSLEAGLWLTMQPAGLYTSTDWLTG